MQNAGGYLLQHFGAVIGCARFYRQQQLKPIDEKIKRGNHLDDGAYLCGKCVWDERGLADGPTSASILDADGRMFNAGMAGDAVLAS